MAVILTESDAGNFGETEIQRMRAMLAATLFRAQTLGARVADFDRDRSPVLISWSETEILEWPADAPPHLVDLLLCFARNGFADLERSPEEPSVLDSPEDTLVARGRDGESSWKFWHDNVRRIQFVRTTRMGPSEKLVSWGSKGERCCNTVVLRNEIEKWVDEMRSGRDTR